MIPAALSAFKPNHPADSPQRRTVSNQCAIFAKFDNNPQFPRCPPAPCQLPCHQEAGLISCQPDVTQAGVQQWIATIAQKKQSRLGAALEHASGDKRFKILEAHMKKHQFRQDALIEVLHKAQELFGFLEDDLLLFVAYQAQAAAQPRLWRGHVLPFLHAQAAGRAHLRRLHGHRLLRQRRGQDLAAVEEKHKIKAGETTPDNQLSLLTARCIGACGIAPAVVYDGTVTPRANARIRARTHQQDGCNNDSLTISIAIAEKERAARKKIVLRCCMAAGCMSSDSKGVKEQLEKAVADAGLEDEVEVRGVGCMKLCCEGPLVAG